MTPTKRTHGYTPLSRVDCTGSTDGATTEETISEGKLWVRGMKPNMNEEQLTGNEQPTGSERLQK